MLTLSARLPSWVPEPPWGSFQSSGPDSWGVREKRPSAHSCCLQLFEATSRSKDFRDLLVQSPHLTEEETEGSVWKGPRSQSVPLTEKGPDCPASAQCSVYHLECHPRHIILALGSRRKPISISSDEGYLGFPQMPEHTSDYSRSHGLGLLALSFLEGASRLPLPVAPCSEAARLAHVRHLCPVSQHLS